jgi:hypothetical protein
MGLHLRVSEREREREREEILLFIITTCDRVETLKSTLPPLARVVKLQGFAARRAAVVNCNRAACWMSCCRDGKMHMGAGMIE